MSGRPCTVRFRIGKAAVPQAKAYVVRILGEWRLGQVSEPAALVTSELVTNAIVHARGIGEYIELGLARRKRALLLEVSDSYSWAQPELRKPGPEETHGRGLLLVDALSEAWGVREREGAGKTVWVRLTL
ncbi:ATP-binding protein [Streptomyces cacaoi]|uniref:ATP-binding protein n=1 Tax=Streptomyces cacaoi TaxID=1898 RepID=UPI00263249B4|nr:ATP-binding protein [Streptomyces cacaoi]